MNRTLLLVALLAPASALAQASEPVAAHDPHDLVVHAGGDHATDRPADTAALSFDERAAALLGGWVRGDLSPTVEAFATDRRAEGEADLARVLRIFTEEYGAMQGYKLVGTETRADGHAETIAKVAFVNGVEQLRFVWGEEGRRPLLTVSRGGRSADAAG